MIEPDPRLQPHEQRVIEEYNTLKSNADKLKAFINSAKFEEVVLEERLRLIEQRHAMDALARILLDRVAYFKRCVEAAS